ncbi:hypothetical protein [Magnetospirillum fulvum]|uniref:hypothetical protein n=1 Tax=Magnetospirillum fulvum TaxID=1082 RepID=UPI00147E8C18|nr:hypothetical protein [Magnetospirillum fulvum]
MMGRKYKGDLARSDTQGWMEEAEAAEMVVSLPVQTRPSGIDPETCRRAQAVAVRQLQARIASYY